MPEGRSQRPEDRRQKSEDGGQKTERDFNRGFRRTGETDLSVFLTAEGARAAEGF